MFSTARFLIRRQSLGIAVLDPQLRADILRVDQIQHDGSFGQDAVEGEPFMALPLVGFAGAVRPSSDTS